MCWIYWIISQTVKTPYIQNMLIKSIQLIEFSRLLILKQTGQISHSTAWFLEYSSIQVLKKACWNLTEGEHQIFQKNIDAIIYIGQNFGFKDAESSAIVDHRAYLASRYSLWFTVLINCFIIISYVKWESRLYPRFL